VKKAEKLILFLIVLIFTVFSFPLRTVYARSFSIKQLDILWDIQKNGDIKVTETYRYDFEGDYNGVIKRIDLDGTSGLSDFTVHIEEYGLDREVFRTDDYSPSKAYTLKKDGNVDEIRVYEKTSDSEKTFRYTYTLKNAIEKYDDMGQLNRWIVDRGNEVPIRVINAEIKIPSGATTEDIRIFAHGDLRGVSEIKDAQTVTLRIPESDPGDGTEVRLLFPVKLIPDSDNIRSGNILQKALQEEGEFAETANRQRDEAKALLEKLDKEDENRYRMMELGKRLSPVFLGMSGLGILGSILAAFKFGKKIKPSFTGEYYRELPGNYPPAVTGYLMYDRNIQSKDILATLLNLAEKKVISIVPYQSVKQGLFGKQKEDTDYMLKDMGGDTSSLSDDERYLYTWFIKELGNAGELKLDDLESMMKSRKTGVSFARKFDVFKDKVKAEGNAQNFWTENSMKGAMPYILTGFLLTGAGAAGIVFFGASYANIISMLSGALLLIILIILATIPRLTEYGADQKAKWNAFRKFLLHFSNMDKNEIPSLAVWNNYLVYATALGVAKEVIDQLPEVFSKEEMDTFASRGGYYPSFYYGGGFYRMDRAINSTVTESMSQMRAQQIANSARSSGSGGGGGFSSGSSGGSGGGGGAGAF